jgi:regulator of Ty1 transposition protein 109
MFDRSNWPKFASGTTTLPRIRPRLHALGYEASDSFMDSSAGNPNLQYLLAEVLPKGYDFSFYHISTPPKGCLAIFAAPQHEKPDKTYCESHILNVSIRPDSSNESDQEIFALAIEVLIYSTKRLTTIFVSKADSTGCLSLLNLPKGAPSPLKAIASTFISWLVKSRQRPGRRLVVSLFARAQDQYLYPGSSDNKSKHILDDRGLIKWWCRVLDPVLREYAPEDLTIAELESNTQAEDATTAKAFLIVPGIDKYETRRFFPKNESPETSRWVYGHPLHQLSAHANAPPRCLIPHFPDDPKARFLDELDDELPELNNSQHNITPSRSNGQWRSVRSLEQFWELMAFRQECSSGRLVGFIWVVFTPADLDESLGTTHSEATGSQISFSSITSDIAQRRKPPGNPRSPQKVKRARFRDRSGPIKPRLPRIKSNSHSSSSMFSAQPTETAYYIWPADSRGSLVLGEKDYQRALELLLGQNFDTRANAVRSTKSWIQEVGVLAGAPSNDWGWTVTGRAEVSSMDPHHTVAGEDVSASNGVNTLSPSIFRKKRKPELEPQTEQLQRDGAANSTANMLGAGLVRKKPKTDNPTPQINNDVNVLATSAIRKRPKAT